MNPCSYRICTSKPSPARYRITNWSSYNAPLRKPGSLPIWVDKEMTWLAPRDGRPLVFSDAAIQFCLSIKVLFKLPLRQSAGKVASLLRMAGPQAWCSGAASMAQGTAEIERVA